MNVKNIDLFEMPEAISYKPIDSEIEINGRYRHYKDKEYVVLAVAKNSENPAQEWVYYRALYGNEESWVRPKESFIEVLEMPGGDGFMAVPRFQYIGHYNDG